jgi:hypothetical protein
MLEEVGCKLDINLPEKVGCKLFWVSTLSPCIMPTINIWLFASAELRDSQNKESLSRLLHVSDNLGV